MARRARSRRSSLRGFRAPDALHHINFQTIPEAAQAWYEWTRKHPHFPGEQPTYTLLDWDVLAEHQRMLARERKARLREAVEAARAYLRPKRRSMSASFSST